LKILKIVFFCSVFFLSCTRKEKVTTNLYSKHNVDSLVKKALDNKLNRKQRFYYAHLTDSIINNTEGNLINNKNYIDLATAYFQLGNNKKYLEIANKLFIKAKKNNDQDGISESAYCIANFFYNEAEYDSAYFYLKKSEKAYLYINEKASLAYVKNIRANILTFKKDHVGAEKLSIEALKIAKKEKYNLLIYNCYLTLGNSLTGLKNYKKAVEYYNKAIEETNNLKKEPKYFIFKALAYDYIADVYQKNLEYNKSIAIAKQALQFDDFKKNDIAIYCYLTNNIAYSKFKLGDKSVLKPFQETLKIGDSIQSIPIQITSKSYLGEYYLAQRDTLKANTYLKEAQLQAHQNNIFEDELKIIKLLQQANPIQETFYADRYIQLNDSLQNVERATRDKFARIEFETDEITSEKEIVKKENNELITKIWVVLGFALLSLFVIILWFMNKSQKAKTRELLLKQEQQKANEEIYQLMINQQQQIEEGKNIEKQRISLELHDGVMGKLSAVRLNLYAALYKVNLIENEMFAKQIDEIQTVEQEIRTIAHDLNSNLFSDNANFIGIVKELFAKIENHSQIHFTLQVSDAVNWDLVNNVVKINLYRILQEALQNIEKYADAKNVAVLMSKSEENELLITISDDGNGFDTKQKKNGIGLSNMKTRVAELNGKITIESALKKGTKINLIIPF